MSGNHYDYCCEMSLESNENPFSKNYLKIIQWNLKKVSFFLKFPNNPKHFLLRAQALMTYCKTTKQNNILDKETESIIKKMKKN